MSDFKIYSTITEEESAHMGQYWELWTGFPEFDPAQSTNDDFVLQYRREGDLYVATLGEIGMKILPQLRKNLEMGAVHIARCAGNPETGVTVDYLKPRGGELRIHSLIDVGRLNDRILEEIKR